MNHATSFAEFISNISPTRAQRDETITGHRALPPFRALLRRHYHGTIRSRLRRANEALRGVIAKLGASPAVVESTISDLDGWARRIREQMGGASLPSKRGESS